MRNLQNYALFQGVWFVAVSGAAAGRPWQGLAAVALMLLVHLWLVDQRLPELRFVLAVGVLGSAADSLLSALGVLSYPVHTQAYGGPWVPPWIVALWLAVGMLPRFSIAWLRDRLPLAAVLGALAGPASVLAGERLGVVQSTGAATWVALGVEYAVAMPILLVFAPLSVRE